MATCILSRLRNALTELETQFLRILFNQQGPPGFQPAIAGCQLLQPSTNSQPPSRWDAFLQDNILWAVPKNRRSLEKRLTRKFGQIQHSKYSVKKKNLMSCLECGSWHEKHTVCGTCYAKVKEETAAMREAMDPETRDYNAPRTEVVHLYRGEEEDKPMYQGKYIVEMKKSRPQWFSKNLLTKGLGKYS